MSLPPPPAPRALPSVLAKEKVAYKTWLETYKNFPRIERLGIGHKIENTFLDILEISFLCVYATPAQKILLLHKAITKLDTLKFFIQLAWESKLLPTQKQAELSEKLEEIGKMLGGWRKGLQKNSHQHMAGE